MDSEYYRNMEYLGYEREVDFSHIDKARYIKVFEDEYVLMAWYGGTQVSIFALPDLIEYDVFNFGEVPDSIHYVDEVMTEHLQGEEDES